MIKCPVLAYLSAGNAVDIRRTVVGVVSPHFSTAEDFPMIQAGTFAQSDHRTTSEQVSKCIR